MAEEKATPEVQRWLNHFAAYDREFKKWEALSDRVIKRYRDESRERLMNTRARFNILWSNIQTLVPAVYARVPKPEVTRRFFDSDPVGRVAALILERAEEYEVQHYPDYKATMKSVVMDRFLGGRGTAWIRYEPHMRAAQQQVAQDGDQVTEDTDEPAEELDYECAPVDYVHWKDFGHTVARTWEEVTAVWRCAYMTKNAIEERFGAKIAKKIPMDAKPEELQRQGYGADEETRRAKVYEIWDKQTKRAIWISKGLKEVLDEKDDPLGLEEFFPCPRPLYATLTNESLIPVPDFYLYQDQANALDIIENRIDGCIKALKVRGVYDAGQKELGRLFTEGNSQDLIPVTNWAAFAEKNGLQGSLDLVDLDPIARALKELYVAFEQQKNQVYELMGISDIVRGQSVASETATAQQLKSQYVGLRLRDMQGGVAAFASELLQLKAQVICNKFAPQTILEIAAAEQLQQQDQQLVMPAMQLLLGSRIEDPESTAPNPMRAFRVEVASDSMLEIDQKEEKESRVEFLSATGQFVKTFEPIMLQAPFMAPLLMEMLRFVTRGYKAGRTIEGVFDQAQVEIQKALSQPKPDPEQQKAEMEMKKMQAEMQFKQQEQQMTLQHEAQKHQLEMKTDVEKHQLEMQTAQQKQQMEMAQQQEQAMFDRETARTQQADEMLFKRQELATQNPETSAVDAEGKSVASPMIKMVESMSQIAQMMAQIAARMEQTMMMVAGPKKLMRDPVTGEKMVVPVNQRMQ